MSLVDRLKKEGFKPSESSDGEWQPYKGTYKVKWVTCRNEVDEKNGNAPFVLAEWDIVETIEGDQRRDSKYPAFRKRYYFDLLSPQDEEKEGKNLEKFLDAAFHFGVDLDYSSPEALTQGFAKLIGLESYVRAYGWKPDGEEKTYQMFNFQKAGVAEKKRTAGSNSL